MLWIAVESQPDVVLFGENVAGETPSANRAGHKSAYVPTFLFLWLGTSAVVLPGPHQFRKIARARELYIVEV